VNNPDLVERAEIIREKGTDRSRFFRGEVDKYTWVDVGSSFLPSELNAAFLLAQFEQSGEISRRRLSLWDRYYEAFGGLEAAERIRRPVIPEGAEHNAHMFYLLTADEDERDALIRYAQGRGVHLVFHYVPLHDSPMGARCGKKPAPLPVTERIAGQVVRLPLYHILEDDEQEQVIDTILSFYQ